METARLTTERPAGRAVVVSSVYTAATLAKQVGHEAYSYRFVFQAFRPLLERWGQTVEVARPARQLDDVVARLRSEGRAPVHLSFLPLHALPLAAQVPNIAFPFWEFPDIPRHDDPAQDWLVRSERLTVVLTASRATRDAFLRAGVRAPVHVVPVPVFDAYFDVPAWEPGQRVVLDCPAYVFPQPEPLPPPPPSRVRRTAARARAWGRHLYQDGVKPYLPLRLVNAVTVVGRAAAAATTAARHTRDEVVTVPYRLSARLELAGVVYTAILNPLDRRKNWEDLLSAFLVALADRPDATLVVKLVVSTRLAAPALNTVLSYYRRLAPGHRCKVAFVTAYLSQRQMIDLARASTFYLNASRAEGACLPLQDFLAAGRPGVTPVHTSIADYFRPEHGFAVASHPEPAPWPHDPDGPLATSWHRLVWRSLCDQIRSSYEMATRAPQKVAALGRRSREQLAGYARGAVIWPKLEAALDIASRTPAYALRKAS